MASKKRSPYGKYSVQDVMKAEMGRYVIQVGDDLFSYNGKTAFSKDRAERYYYQIWDGLEDMFKNGNKKERADAYKCLIRLQMFPLRIN